MEEPKVIKDFKKELVQRSKEHRKQRADFLKWMVATGTGFLVFATSLSHEPVNDDARFYFFASLVSMCVGVSLSVIGIYGHLKNNELQIQDDINFIEGRKIFKHTKFNVFTNFCGRFSLTFYILFMGWFMLYEYQQLYCS